MKFWCMAAATAAFVFLGGCAGHEHPAEAETSPAVRPVAVLKVGEEMTVTLEEIPGSGYSWSSMDFDSEVLTLLSDRRIAPPGALIGAPCRRVRVFRAVAPGTTQLNSDYRRPWETMTAPAKTFRCPVSVVQ